MTLAGATDRLRREERELAEAGEEGIDEGRGSRALGCTSGHDRSPEHLRREVIAQVFEREEAPGHTHAVHALPNETKSGRPDGLARTVPSRGALRRAWAGISDRLALQSTYDVSGAAHPPDDLPGASLLLGSTLLRPALREDWLSI